MVVIYQLPRILFHLGIPNHHHGTFDLNPVLDPSFEQSRIQFLLIEVQILAEVILGNLGVDPGNLLEYGHFLGAEVFVLFSEYWHT